MLQPLWNWAILGVLLLGVEMLTGTFYILWFGIAALSVALLVALFPQLSTAMQLLAFSVLSLTSLGVWRIKYAKIRPQMRVGQSRGEEIGRVGRITQLVSPQTQGRIEFTLPVLGSREWVAISEQTLQPGDEAQVVRVEGNYLRVERKQH
jgi:membrane protein implicated in regulation of membrane protease activity